MDCEKDLKIEIENFTRDRDSAKQDVRLLERKWDSAELKRLKLEDDFRKSRSKCEELEEKVDRLQEEIKMSNNREKRTEEQRDKIFAMNTKMTLEKNRSISELKTKTLENERLIEEIEGLTREKLDDVKTIEVLRAEIIAANKTVDELRKKESQSDKVAELHKKIEEGLYDILTVNRGNVSDSAHMYKRIGKPATSEERANLGFAGSEGKNDSSGSGSSPDEVVAVNATSPAATGKRKSVFPMKDEINLAHPWTRGEDDVARNTIKTPRVSQLVHNSTEAKESGRGPLQAESNKQKETLDSDSVCLRFTKFQPSKRKMSSSNSDISILSSLPFSELIKHIKHSLLEPDFNEVQKILMEHENDLKTEIENLTRDRDFAKEEVRLLEINGDLVELERLSFEGKLRKSQRKCEELEDKVARLIQEKKVSNYLEKKHRETMTFEKNKSISELNDKINELTTKNLETERLMVVHQEKCKCLEIKIAKMDREIEGLTREKSDAFNAIEELRAENSVANKTINELRLQQSASDKMANLEERPNLEFLQFNGKNDSLGNGSTPDDSEIVVVNGTLPGLRKSSISTSKKDARVSGTHALMPGEGRSSKIARLSSAAGDIIEIIDSDNETDPNGGDGVSNVGENEMNFVQSPLPSQRSKRNRADVDNALLNHKARPADDYQTPLEKLDDDLDNDEVYTDSDDSCRDSRMDDLIASFRSRAGNKNRGMR